MYLTGTRCVTWRNLLWFLSAILILLAGLTNPAYAAENITVFIYHKFGEDRYPTTNVSLERFAEQMRYLHENSYEVIPLAEVVRLLGLKKPLPDKTVAITVDDAYDSTYTGAWPILKKYGYPFTVFLYGKAVEKGYSNYLSWAQIKEMQGQGVDFQDHGYSHYRMGYRPEGMSESEYRAWLSEDLEKGRSTFRKNLGLEPEFLALPYGEYNSVVIETAQKAGYKAVFSQDPGSLSQHIDGYAIPREPILGNEWASMQHFTMVLERGDLPVTDPSPEYMPLLDTFPKQFCATLVYPDRYQKGSLGIYVSELGWKQASLDGSRACIDNSVSLERRTNRVAISAVEKGTGRKAIHYWLLINPLLQPPAD